MIGIYVTFCKLNLQLNDFCNDADCRRIINTIYTGCEYDIIERSKFCLLHCGCGFRRTSNYDFVVCYVVCGSVRLYAASVVILAAALLSIFL